MLIYERIGPPPSGVNFTELAKGLLKHLLPEADLLSFKVEPAIIYFILQDGLALCAFAFCPSSLGAREIGDLAKLLTESELVRKQKNLPPKSTRIYVVARYFSADLFTQIRSDFRNARIYQWDFIRSTSGDALCIYEHHPGIIEEQDSHFPTELRRSNEAISNTKSAHEMTTSELIAFARLGMELRERSLKASGILLR